MTTLAEAVALWSAAKPLTTALENFDISRLTPIESVVVKAFPWWTGPRAARHTWLRRKTLIYPIANDVVVGIEDSEDGPLPYVEHNTYAWITRNRELVARIGDNYFILSDLHATLLFSHNETDLERVLCFLRDDSEGLFRIDIDELQTALLNLELPS